MFVSPFPRGNTQNKKRVAVIATKFVTPRPIPLIYHLLVGKKDGKRDKKMRKKDKH